MVGQRLAVSIGEKMMCVGSKMTEGIYENKAEKRENILNGSRSKKHIFGVPNLKS